MSIKEVISKGKESISDAWYKVYNFVWKEVEWVKKSISYAIFLRNDCDFDYSSMLKLFLYKIGRMRKTIKENNIIVRSEEVCAQMKHAEALLQLLIDNDFGDEEYKAHNKKWGVEFFPKDCKGWKVARNAKTPADEAQMDKEFREVMELQERLRVECEDEFFDHLKRYYREWWD